MNEKKDKEFTSTGIIKTLPISKELTEKILVAYNITEEATSSSLTIEGFGNNFNDTIDYDVALKLENSKSYTIKTSNNLPSIEAKFNKLLQTA